jgi:riboflavin synthase
MFTGIVSDIGIIARVEARGDTRIVVDTAYDTTTVDLGASIACSGVCLTVVDKGQREGGPNWFAVDVSGETISRTATDQWTQGRKLNLERAMKLGEELGGHIVTGHVDGVAEVLGVDPDGDSLRIGFAVPASIAPFLAPKGSITVDGVSLTVNTVEDHGPDADNVTHFSVNIIPHTQGATTLGALAQGQSVNIEIDVLARYLQRMEHYRAKIG